MTDSIKAVRGMRDILPDKTPAWHYLESTVQNVLSSYGYREIRVPVLEKTELFERSIGEATDIVSKEMYTFADRNGEMLTLRPEATASCVRAGIEHGLFHNQVQKLWYCGQMFRYERPQKGRMRQFHQIGAEAFGLHGPDIDAETILMSARLWKSLGIKNLKLELNTLGSAETRNNYREHLVAYFKDHSDLLDEDSRTRIDKNPLRILDSKNPDMQELINAAPVMTDYLDKDSAEHFNGLRKLLDVSGLQYEINPRLVRGLDYYNKTVFEWITEDLGAQGTICAGGRYDGLVERFGGKPTPGTGFAMGLERILDLIDEQDVQNTRQDPHIYFINFGDNTLEMSVQLCERIRDELPDIRLYMHCGGGSIKSQFKKADKSGAKYALILGDEELVNETISIKALRSEQEQRDISWTSLIEELKTKF